MFSHILSCWHQHEYQHQLEFTHEVSTSSTSTEAVRGRGERRRGGVSTGRSLNGTGARGRTVAVAADRIRAERSLRQGVGQDLLGVHGGDAREAQRARWILRMQEQMEEKGAAEVRGSDPSPSSNRVPSLLSDGVQLVPPPAVSSAPIPSRHSSLSSSLGLRNLAGSSEAEAAPLETGQRRNDVVGRKRVSHGWRALQSSWCWLSHHSVFFTRLLTMQIFRPQSRGRCAVY